jgi:hypothetical protein
MLELAEDGGAKGCAWSEAHDDSSKSKYATPDGKPSRNESDDEQRFGMRGTWKAERTGIVVEMDAVEYRNCEVGPGATEPSTPIQMHCFALDAGDGLPVAAMACRVDETSRAIDAVAMLLADTPRSGSWDLREDLAKRGPDTTPVDAKPWLLLGADPGLHIEHDDGPREPLNVELEARSVTVPVGETPTRTP